MSKLTFFILTFCILALGFFNVLISAQVTTTNFISNGNFSENNCSRLYCISNETTMVKDWIPDPQIQIGYANKYTDFQDFRTQRMIELVAEKNTCIKQKIAFLAPGYYKLAIDYTARKNFPITNGQFTIQLNGNLMKTVIPSSYQVMTQNLQIQVKNGCGVELRLCGVGNDTRSNGAIIKLVQLLTSTPSGTPGQLFDPCPSPFTPGIYFESHSGICYQKQYNFVGGTLEMSLDYSVVSSIPVTLSSMKIFIDNVQNFNILPVDSGKSLNFTLPLLTQGLHTIKFCPNGAVGQNPHRIQISNIVIKERYCYSFWSQNLLKNGGFEETYCKSTYCKYTNTSYFNYYIPYWLPSPQIQIGVGTFYNSRLVNTMAIEMDASTNTCSNQTVTLQPGKYMLTIISASKQGIAFTSQGYEVRLDTNLLRSYVPIDYLIKTDVINFTLTTGLNSSIFSICGIGTGDQYGTAIDKITLSIFNQCTQESNYKYGPFPRVIINTTDPNTTLLSTNITEIAENTISIDSNSNKCTQITNTYAGGNIKITFDFDVVSTGTVNLSALLVKFADSLVSSVSAKKKGTQIQIDIPSVLPGQYILALCPYLNLNDPAHTNKVSKLTIEEKQCTSSGWSSDLIKNGGFQETICKTYCKYYEGYWQPDYVPGWYPYPEIQIGYGTNYNAKAVNTNIMELDATRNTCIRQKLALRTGKYILTFATSARQGAAFDSLGFEAKINGQVLKRGVPINYDSQNHTVQFSLSFAYPVSQIQFCGIGRGDDYGSLVDNVTLSYFDECATFKRNIY